MDADYDIFEIVTVIHDYWLIDAESYQRRYCTDHDLPLAPGHYVVNWPDHVKTRRFNTEATFFGPFLVRQEAQAVREWLNQERIRAEKMSSQPPCVFAPDFTRMNILKAA